MITKYTKTGRYLHLTPHGKITYSDKSISEPLKFLDQISLKYYRVLSTNFDEFRQILLNVNMIISFFDNSIVSTFNTICIATRNLLRRGFFVLPFSSRYAHTLLKFFILSIVNFLLL